MIPFVVLLIVPIIIQHIRIRGINYQKRNAFALRFFFAVLTLLVAFRHETVGNDTKNYIRFFINISNTPWGEWKNSALEIGYVYLNKLVSFFSREPQVFFVVCALMVSAMMYPTYKRLCVDSALTIVVFCVMSTFVMMFSGIRQMIAIGIGFIAYDFTRKRKWKRFLICVLIAMTIHSSAFMLLFMYPVYHARITKKWLCVVVPVMGVVLAFNRPIFEVLLGIMARFSRFEGAAASTGAYTMLVLFALFAIFAFLIPDENQIDSETIGLRNFLLLSLVVQMFAPLHMLAMRMNYYYIIFIPLLLPKVVMFRRERWSQMAIIGRHIMVGFFLLYFFAVIYRSGILHVFPYHFFWEIL